MAILAVTIIAMIMLYVGTQTVGSLVASKRKSDRSVGMAAGDAGIEWTRLALQYRLIGETDDYALTAADMDRLIDTTASTSVGARPKRIANGNFPGLTPSPLPAAQQVTMRMPGNGGTGATDGYWQVYNVIPPHFGSPASPLVIFVRAWAAPAGNPNKLTSKPQLTSKPRVFRVEYRPGYASDYQMVSDGPITVIKNSEWTINGPIHSNGFQTSNWKSFYEDLGGAHPSAAHRLGIFAPYSTTFTCKPTAKFSIAQGALDDPEVVRNVRIANGCAAAFKARKLDAEMVSLGGAETTVQFARQICAPVSYSVQCFGAAGATPHLVQLDGCGNAVRVDGKCLAFQPLKNGDSEHLVLVLGGDVRVRGALPSSPGKVRRVTIASYRDTSGTARLPRIYLESSNGVVGAAKPERDVVGVVAPGDIVLRGAASVDPALPPSSPCLTNVNLAAVSQSGAITYAPELMNPSPPTTDTSNFRCNGKLTMNGSFAAHGEPMFSHAWQFGTSTASVGYAKVALIYNRQLLVTPPPLFPETSPWGVTEAGDANARCLTTAPKDPACR